MAKIFNLDKLDTKEKRFLLIGGIKHEIAEMTVENFIETTRSAQRLQDEKNISVHVEATVDMILRSVPTLDRSVLVKLSLEKLQAALAFVRGDEEPEDGDQKDDQKQEQVEDTAGKQ